MLFARVYFPFALGYAISYFYRNANAIIESDLVDELGLGARDLGLLTSAYFFFICGISASLRILLDRYGPRRTEALAFICSSGGMDFLKFDTASGLIQEVADRLGVSACLMAAFKAFVIWFQSERLPMIKGLQMVAGGLGGLGATTPLQNFLSIGLARCFLRPCHHYSFCLNLFMVVLPEHHSSAEKKPEFKTQLKEMGRVFPEPVFWSIAPLTRFQREHSWQFRALLDKTMAEGCSRSRRAGFISIIILNDTVCN
ncbi:MAG: hypothetical protein Ct9H300mP28_25620 [Pseudomonadota bacterium]|nr:MAG: hypothetical protein Ct9H300mP28_25620 [Pseudomonadota bacterium]